MKKNIIKKYFTLLELVITIALITICFSVIGINVSRSLYKHRYKNNLKKIDLYFGFCKKMAYFNQSDVHMKLSQDDKKICCEMGTDETMGFFENSKKIEDAFDHMKFLFNKKKVDKLDVLFSSTGEVLPKGDLEFLDNKDKIN
jgi:Tfp pilus assembly protein FimT